MQTSYLTLAIGTAFTFDAGRHGLHVSFFGRGVHIAVDRRGPGEAFFWRAKDDAGVTYRIGPLVIVRD